MRRHIIIGSAIVLAIAGFFAGRTAGSGTARTTAVAVSRAEAGGAAAVRPRTRLASRLRSVAAPDPAELASTKLEAAPLEETREATIARRAETNARLTEELGPIADDQRGLLVDLNDRAIEFQRRLTGELERGTINHEEYMRQFHEEMLSQLDELHAIVTDEQYRIVTGLEPGVDPYDFMKTGEGGAAGSAIEEPPLTAAEARFDKKLPGTTGGEGAP